MIVIQDETAAGSGREAEEGIEGVSKFYYSSF
jgi:hypothetical protein